MSAGTQSKDDPPLDPSRCLARSVVHALSEDPSLEAVTIDRARKTISVATLGRANVPRLTERISGTFERAQESQRDHQCTLLQGEGECQNCVAPLTELQRQKISILHEADKTTIARVTCPVGRSRMSHPTETSR